MAILAAFNWPDVEVIGLTTLFGNVPTRMATRNAIVIRELAAQHDPARHDLPVVQGSLNSFAGLEQHRIADFVHGADGFGGQNFPEPQVPSSRMLARALPPPMLASIPTGSDSIAFCRVCRSRGARATLSSTLCAPTPGKWWCSRWPR